MEGRTYWEEKSLMEWFNGLFIKKMPGQSSAWQVVISAEEQGS